MHRPLDISTKRARLPTPPWTGLRTLGGTEVLHELALGLEELYCQYTALLASSIQLDASVQANMDIPSAGLMTLAFPHLPHLPPTPSTGIGRPNHFPPFAYSFHYKQDKSYIPERRHRR